MLIKKDNYIKSSEITDEEIYMNRRQFIAGSSLTIMKLASPNLLFASDISKEEKLHIAKRGQFVVNENKTSYNNATTYNNFYEFSTKKDNIAELSRNFLARPWTIAVEGHIKRPKIFDIDELTKMFPLEERVYRFRCVEAWSMVIPWIGFPLSNLVKRCEPASKAKYVEFTTLYDPEQMPGQRRGVLDWPYVEGLRMDEAMHPLTLMSMGMYGDVLPNQNGAPFRLIVPWKYGFKSIKSIVRIRFVEKMPTSSWMKAIPEEYGFYANVNPKLDHPRWSQGRERRIGEFFKRKTLMFNGYADQVGSLYTNMDLKKFY